MIDSVAVDFSNASVNVYCEDSVESLTVEYPQAQTLRGKDTSKITVSDENGRLSIHERQIWFYNLCSIGNKSPKINVYLPTGRAYTLSLIVDNGTINLHGDFHNVKKIVLETDNGEIQISGCVDAQTITLYVDVGEIVANLTGAQADYSISVENDVGNSNVYPQTGGTRTLNVATDVGDIRITFLG